MPVTDHAMQILYMDAERLPGGNQYIAEERLVRAIREIRAQKLFKDIAILLCIENAPGPVGPFSVYMLDQYQNRTGNSLGRIHIMCECAGRKAGVPKTKETTEQMVRFSATEMRFNRVFYSKGMRVGAGVTVKGMRDKLQQQMSEFRCEMKYNKNDIHAEPKYKWMGRQDDLLVTFMMALYWKAVFESSNWEPYRRFRELCK